MPPKVSKINPPTPAKKPTTSLNLNGSPRTTGSAPKTPKGSGSVLDRIQPIGFDADEGIKMLLYGRSGTGKTTLWGTFPKKILAVICSGGDRPGELRSLDTPENRSQISQVTLESSQELIDIVNYAHGGAFDTIVLDHASGLQDRVLAELLGMDELPAQKTWGLATQQQYGQCTLQCKELLRSLLGLTCNVVIIAQERNFGDDSGSDLILPTVGAGLTPSLAGWLNTAVDYICQTFIRQKEKVSHTTIGVGKNQVKEEVREKIKGIDYCLRTAPDPVYTTKFRQPRGAQPLPEVIIDPSYKKIMELVKQGAATQLKTSVK